MDDSKARAMCATIILSIRPLGGDFSMCAAELAFTALNLLRIYYSA